MRRVFLFAVSCAHSPPPIVAGEYSHAPIGAGEYHVELDATDTVRTVSLSLASSGAAQVVATEQFWNDGPPARGDTTEITMTGSWRASGEVHVTLVHACIRSIFVSGCHETHADQTWHLDCSPSIEGLRCRFLGVASPPRWTVAFGDRRYLVMGNWLRYVSEHRLGGSSNY